MRQTFKLLFCGRFDCAPEHFEELALKECLPPHARIVAPIIRTAAPDFFYHDLKFIRDLGEVTSWRAAHTEILTFKDEIKADGSLLRYSWRIRVSGRRATRLAASLLRRENDAADDPARPPL